MGHGRSTSPSGRVARAAVALVALVILLGSPFAVVAKGDEPITRIAFGSCHKGEDEQIWKAIQSTTPQVWVWLGDIIYGDSADPRVLRRKYEALQAIPAYRELMKSSSIIGTWDDHDYGLNNGGKEFVGKKTSQQELLDFLGTPTDSPRRSQKGVYWSHKYGDGERSIKIVLLDCRYHRDDTWTKNGDVLGADQWRWLEQELDDSSVAFIVIASGIQVIPQDHRFEKWEEFPAARERLLNLVSDSAAHRVVFISGDRHLGEISRLDLAGIDYPLFDATSSSLTSSLRRPTDEENRHRVGEPFVENNFGLIEIDWEQRQARILIMDESGQPQRIVELGLSTEKG